MTVTTQQWEAVRTSVRETSDRLADLLVNLPAGGEPAARATRRWSVVETAAHVASVAALHRATLRPGEASLPVPDLASRLHATTVDTVSALNDLALAHLPEREPGAVAARLRTEVGRLLDATGDLGPADAVEWLGGARVPAAGIGAHMLNELSIHGRDIARAVGAPWVIPEADAAAFFDMFVVGMVRSGYGRLLDAPGPPSPRRVVVEFAPRRRPSVILMLHNGQVSVREAPARVDVRVSYEPTMFNLMMFGRVSKARAILTGKVLVGGPRPWLLPTFLRTVRMPA